MYSDRVVDILEYVNENPLNVKSEKMYYGECLYFNFNQFQIRIIIFH